MKAWTSIGCVLALGATLLGCNTGSRSRYGDRLGTTPGSTSTQTTSTSSPSTQLASAELVDRDLDGQATPGDEVVLGFSSPVALNATSPSVIALSAGDTFGAGATLVERSGNLHVVLGAGSFLTANQGGTQLAVSTTMPSGAIVDRATGVDVVTGTQVVLQDSPSLVNALIIDADEDTLASPGDTLVMQFDRAIAVDPSLSAGQLITLPVAGDSLGMGATLTTGAANELRVPLGRGVNLGVQGVYDSLQQSAGSASGLLLGGQPTGSVTDPLTGLDMQSVGVIDIAWTSTGAAGAITGVTPTAIGPPATSGNPTAIGTAVTSGPPTAIGPPASSGTAGTVNMTASPNPVAAGGNLTFTVTATGTATTAQVKFLRVVYPVNLVNGRGSVTVPVPASQNGRRSAQATVAGVEKGISVQVNGGATAAPGGDGRFSSVGTLSMRALDGKTVYAPGETVNIEVTISGWTPNPDSVKIRLVEWNSSYTQRLRIIRGPGVPSNANYLTHIKLTKRNGRDVVTGSFKAPSKPGSYLTVAKRLEVFSNQFRFRVQ